jgi:hypothetical protein
MAIEFVCECGARFRVGNEMAGRKARCKACKQYVIIPAAPPSAPVMQSAAVVGPLPLSIFDELALQPAPESYSKSSYSLQPLESRKGPDDVWMDRQIAYHQAVTQSAASIPGRLRINHIKHWMSFPFWPSLWCSLVLAGMIGGMVVNVAFLIVSLVSLIMLGKYWSGQREKFISGCVNPGVVVSLHPPLVAVFTDLTTGATDRNFPCVKVLRQPLGSMTGEVAHVGQRLATVALYMVSLSRERWSTFFPVVVNCVTRDRGDIARVFSTLGAEDWRQLETGLQQISRPYTPGLYLVEV